MDFLDSPNGSAATPTVTPPVLVTMLETFIPGLSLLTRFLSDYFKIDITQYLFLILVIAALTTVFNYCSVYFWSFWNQYLVSTAQIHYNDETYNYIMYWISRQGLSKNAKHFIAGTSVSSSYVYTGEEDDESDQYEDEDQEDDVSQKPKNWDRMKTLRYTPSQGTHYFRFRGTFIAFTREQKEENGWYGHSIKESIYLSCLGRDTQILKDLISEAQRAYTERDGSKTIIYRATKPIGGSSEDMEFVRCLSKSPRPLSTVVLGEAQKQMILDDMKEYLHPWTKRWYSNRGIPYRRGYLLHGPPGTGKTSLCFALAGVLQLRIYVISLNSRSITEDSLASLFRNLPHRCIVLMEDIDSAGLAVKRGEGSNKESEDNTQEVRPSENKPLPAAPTDNSAVNKALSFSGLLNTIDGVASNEGRILVLTTNHPDKLDPALLRPGRVDMTVKFEHADSDMAKGIFKAIYSTFDSEHATKPAKEDPKSISEHKRVANGSRTHYLHHGRSDEEIIELADQFALVLPEKEFTPAEIQNFLLKHKIDPQKAVDDLPAWIEQTREEKKARGS